MKVTGKLVKQWHTQLTWEAIEKLLGGSLVSENELQVIDILRQEANGLDVAPASDDERDEFRQMISRWRERDQRFIDAAMLKVG